MQPRNPYQGTPTSNMDFPTEAYLAASADAAKTQANAQAQMGQAIGAGLQKVGAAVGGYLEEKADFEASMKLYDSPSFQKAMGLDEEQVKTEKTNLKQLKDEGGYKAANAYSQQQIGPLFKYAMMGKELEMQKQLIGAKAAAESGLIGQRFQSDLSLSGAKSLLDRKPAAGSALPVSSTSTFEPKSFTIGGENREYSWMLPPPKSK